MDAETQNAKYLLNNGYCFIPGVYYEKMFIKNSLSEEDYSMELEGLRQGFVGLKIDPYSPGNRYRSHIQCRLGDRDSFIFGHFVDYLQTPEYNPDTGGIVRSYPPIDDRILNNKLFKFMFLNDVSIIDEYKIIGSPKDLNISVHLFRYEATAVSPAYSSPLWLHKDDEDIVFVHWVAVTKNMLGGDSIIASNPKIVERVFRLENIFDTLVVTHGKFHAVTPIGCRSNEASEVSTRDVILVTFQKANQP
jgi:hypothetical protein